MSDKKVKAIKSKYYDRMNELKPLVVLVTIVNRTQGNAIVKICESHGASMQFIESGHGTAQNSILQILGINDNSKDVVFSILRQEAIPELKQEIEAFFLASKRNKGIAFTIKLTTVAGIRIYQYLADIL